MNLGKRIYEERTRSERNWTQQELSEATGGVISQQSIHNLETRDSKTSEHLFAIADAFMVEARWLMTGEGPKEKAPTVSIDAIFPGIEPEKWESLGPRRQGIVEERLRVAIDAQLATGFGADLGNTAGRQTAPPKSAAG